MAGVPDKVLNWLYSVLTSEYKDVNRTYHDAAEALSHYPSLTTRTEVYTYENGTSALLLLLGGTLPVTFRGAPYGFPVAVWVPHGYPREAPMVYVTPSPDMVVRPGQHVGGDGRVYHPYLAQWAQYWDKSSLFDFLAVLRAVFAKEPPVRARQPQHGADEASSSPALPRHRPAPPPRPPKPADQSPHTAHPLHGRYSQPPPPPLPPHPPLQHPPLQHPPLQHPPLQHPPLQHPPLQHPPPQQHPPHQPGTPSQYQQPQQSASPNPPINLLDDSLTVTLPSQHPNQPALPVPPVPPNPEKDALLRALSHALVAQTRTTVSSNIAALTPLRSQHAALSTAYTRLQSELVDLEQVDAALLANEQILKGAMEQADGVMSDARRRQVPDVDDILVAPTLVGGQLYTLVSDEKGIADALFVLGRGLDRGRVGVDVFVKQTRSLAREQFLKKALIRKIGRGMGLDDYQVR